MRIAALADIHGNIRALEAVLADLRRHAPDLVVNLGDHAAGPLEGAATCELLRTQSDWIQIRGNQDRSPVPAVLSDVQREWLDTLPPTLQIEDILLCHGTPECDHEYLLEEVTASGVTLATHDAVRLLAGTYQGLILCGHSHIPRVVRLNDGTMCVNPGSVGLQAYSDRDHRFPHRMENGSPHARYMLLDRTAQGWTTTARLLEYDWHSASRTARANGRTDWAHALVTGYYP